MTSLGPSIRTRTSVPAPVRLAWRVGASGRLEVLLELTRAEADFAPMALHGRWRLERAGRVESGSVSGNGSLLPVASGSDLELEAELVLDCAPGTKTVALAIARARSNPVVLTDLPAALGLPGGTYVLDADGTTGLLPPG